MWQVGAQRVADGHGTVAAAHPDVHVRGPRVVAPRDVLETVLDQPVVRRVDDLLVLPRGEGVRAGGAERDALAVREGEQLGAVQQQLLRRLAEVQGARRGHLDLGAQQLAGDAPAQPLGGGVAQRLEARGERQGLGVEDLELLLEAEVEVERALEAGLDLFEVCVVVDCHAHATLPNGRGDSHCGLRERAPLRRCDGETQRGRRRSRAAAPAARRRARGAAPSAAPRGCVLAVATASIASSA